MIRQPEHEQVQRLAVKTLDHVFVARACEGLGCSLFEAHALTDLVKEVCFPWLAQPEAIRAGQLALACRSRAGRPQAVRSLPADHNGRRPRET